ncbi:hypothetical protein RIF29_38379 [Crotalaria pallida]|uniref:NADH dehydrogenase subunit 4L n=1 Tax=Crotalaria pallida TaxID=3830 RepID=A0AAN9DZT9_CROPI
MYKFSNLVMMFTLVESVSVTFASIKISSLGIQISSAHFYLFFSPLICTLSLVNIIIQSTRMKTKNGLSNLHIQEI